MRRETDQEIIKFDGKNYHEWSAAAKFTLMSKGLWQQVIEKPLERKEKEDEKAFKTRMSEVSSEMKIADNKALGIIGKTVKSDYLLSVYAKCHAIKFCLFNILCAFH